MLTDSHPPAPAAVATPVPAALLALEAKPGQPELPPTFNSNYAFLRRLLVYIKPYKVRFILGEMAGLAFAFFNGMMPLLLKAVLDHADQAAKAAGAPKPITPPKAAMFGGLGKFFEHLADGHYGLFLVCAAIPGIMILRCLFDYANNYCITWISLRVLTDIRRQVFEHISRQSLQFFLQNRSGTLINRVANEARIIQTALGFLGTDLVEQPVTAVIIIFVLFRLDPRFTLIALVLFPICMMPVVIYGKRIRKSGKQEEEQGGAMVSILQETFAGIRVIKSFAREDYQVDQFHAANLSQFHTGIRVRRYTEIVGPMVEIVAAMGVGLAVFYVIYAHMPLSTFISLTGGMFLLYAPIKQISRMHVQLQRCRAASENIFRLLELQPTVQDAPDARPLTTCQGNVLFKELSFQYENAPSLALNNFNLRIKAGKTVALVGESGAGKSTVLSLLQRFYDPQHGGVFVDGEDVRTFTQRSLREQIGVVTQDTFLFHDTIYENIRYGRLDATTAEIEDAARQAYIHDFILTLPEGYQTITGDKGCRLSGGQQQRLAIARALLKNAPILLLDEATSALDTESERMIQNALEKLSAGKTVIAIAHRLSTILKADQIIVMDAGQIVEKGKHANLYAKEGRYRRLYDLQFDHESHLQEMATATEVLLPPGDADCDATHVDPGRFMNRKLDYRDARWTFRCSEMSVGVYSCEASRHSGHNFSRTGFEPSLAQTLYDMFEMELGFGTALGEAAFHITAACKLSWRCEYDSTPAGSWRVESPRLPNRIIYDGDSLQLALYSRADRPTWQGHIADLQVPASGYFKALVSSL